MDNKVVNIVGRGENFLKVNDYIENETWIIGDMYNAGIQKFDKLFETHKKDKIKIFKNRQSGTNLFEDLCMLNCEIITIEEINEFKKCVVFPFNFFTKEETYFTSSFCYMMAYAIIKGYKIINLFGVSMYTTKEYTQQRDGVAYWTGIARGKGIKVNFITNTNILCNFRYGIDDDIRDLQMQPFIFNLTTLFEDITRDMPNKIQLRVKLLNIGKTMIAMERIIKGERVVGSEFKNIIHELYNKMIKKDFVLDKDDNEYVLCITEINKKGGKMNKCQK